jgi:hypothetical protein
MFNPAHVRSIHSLGHFNTKPSAAKGPSRTDRDPSLLDAQGSAALPGAPWPMGPALPRLILRGLA